MDQPSSSVSPTMANASSSTRELPFEFRGDGMEYFKIWIVNIMLTVVTLGIYSAWAKVRNERYFHSNLYLDGTNFRYLAEPLQILKGRLIAIAAFIGFSFLSSMAPLVGAAVAIAFTLAIPYFVNMALRFDRRMSAYKNIQFRFHGSYGEAFMVLFVWPLLGIVTLGILYPLALLKMHEYISKNSAYGTTQFDYQATYGDYGIIFLTALGIGIVGGIAVFALMYVGTMIHPALGALGPIIYVVLYLMVIAYLTVAITNLFYSSLSIQDNEFVPSLNVVAYAKVLLICGLLILITLGLYFPAAKVRITKYIADNVTFKASGALDNFAAAEKEQISALGEEFGEVFDFGI